MTVTRAADPRPSGEDRQAPELVLVVDDEPGIRRIIARILLEAGYSVHEASDGIEALELIKSGDPETDVVVSDIVMPRLNGIELLEELSRNRPDLPIILISGYGTAELSDRGIISPCAVLNKPFTPERLLAEVRRCIAERR